MHLDGALLRSSTGIAFYTQPKSWVSPPTAYFNELVATAILGCAIIALGDDTNAPPGAGMHAFIIGLIVFVLDTAFSPNTSACLNPTRDLAPRIVASMAGYGKDVWTDANWWWIWGPWCADITGCLLGAFCYDVLIFVGSESPINYPKLRRKQAKVGLKVRWGRIVGKTSNVVRGWEKEEEILETGLQHHS
jgi:aquaglyceroporin related protein